MEEVKKDGEKQVETHIIDESWFIVNHHSWEAFENDLVKKLERRMLDFNCERPYTARLDCSINEEVKNEYGYPVKVVFHDGTELAFFKQHAHTHGMYTFFPEHISVREDELSFGDNMWRYQQEAKSNKRLAWFKTPEVCFRFRSMTLLGPLWTHSHSWDGGPLYEMLHEFSAEAIGHYLAERESKENRAFIEFSRLK